MIRHGGGDTFDLHQYRRLSQHDQNAAKVEAAASAKREEEGGGMDEVLDLSETAPLLAPTDTSGGLVYNQLALQRCVSVYFVVV
jgi:hypothetical protein